ncbi:hypothetical protein [Frankia sp. QA3]|uniref:hypothetical protein n=1 Tax=Frankia sp. QA3 TaxID=710111 RepID=UPI000311BDCA|nr:hypothetical protein [Frankia sp. QA3]
MGLASWIYTLFQDNTGTPGNAEASLPLSEILDTVMLYWLPNAGPASARLYWETARSRWTSPARPDQPITVPAAFSLSPQEAVQPSRRWAESRYSNLAHFQTVVRGGHFAAWCCNGR